MKKFAIASLVLVSSAAWAAPVVSDNASPNACFGQARAATIHLITGRTWGEIAAMRGGTNSDLNAAYRDGCQP